ncbi:DUF3575 domain-containing protein [Flavobacterium sp.]|uniref:DUF3575 domain-containing protein n=1 Tax=Flavobacterium sp. TaxID=239 RepID=UPI003750741B
MKNKLFLITSLLFTMMCSSQVKVYTPSSSGKAKEDNSYKWVVKTDLFGYVSGEFPIAFEYRLAQKFSVEASAGVTYAFFPNESIFGNNDSNNDSSYDTKAALGSAFRGTFKYYPSSDYDAIEGWFFGIQAFTKTTNREYTTNNYTTTTPSTFEGKKDSKNKTGLSLIIGKQLFQDSNIAFESFIGIGLANVNREYYTNTSTYDSTTSTYISSIDLVKTNETIPNFQLGFKIGFGN